MRNERRTSGSGMGAAETGAGNRAMAPRSHFHWIDGGETRVENLTFVCRRHHRFLHEHGFSAFRGDAGELVFQAPEGRVVPPTGEEGLRQAEACERVRQRREREGREPGSAPPVPRWDGAPPDCGAPWGGARWTRCVSRRAGPGSWRTESLSLSKRWLRGGVRTSRGFGES
jgi:hypothetical protein